MVMEFKFYNSSGMEAGAIEMNCKPIGEEFSSGIINVLLGHIHIVHMFNLPHI